jgi:hypothetical protein
VLKHDEELDAEGDGLDVQRVVLIDACVDAVVLTRVFEVADAMTLPFFEK